MCHEDEAAGRRVSGLSRTWSSAIGAQHDLDRYLPSTHSAQTGLAS
jgi:hypothetical protein